jgi:hypothetical protein
MDPRPLRGHIAWMGDLRIRPPGATPPGLTREDWRVIPGRGGFMGAGGISGQLGGLSIWSWVHELWFVLSSFYIDSGKMTSFVCNVMVSDDASYIFIYDVISFALNFFYLICICTTLQDSMDAGWTQFTVRDVCYLLLLQYTWICIEYFSRTIHSSTTL